MRRRVAVEAARLMSESGIRDFQMAKRKAAERLGANDKSQLPNNAEIEDALREHQRLFQSDEQPQTLRRLREEAREAMKFFKDFDPRLVGRRARRHRRQILSRLPASVLRRTRAGDDPARAKTASTTKNKTEN